MKQGSADDPFAEDPNGESADNTTDPKKDSTSQSDQSDLDNGSSQTDTPSKPDSNSDSSSVDESRSLPYIYARDSVKDGRQQRPIFLRDEIENDIPELVDKLESSLGENVYRTDVLEAAVVVAQENPDLVEAELETWGYGWE